MNLPPHWGSESITMRRRSHLSEPKKKERFFTNLPSEIIVDILSRLPVRTIICCKCVCKPWLDLLETDEFVKSHLSKSVPGLVLKGKESCNIFEFEDGLDLGHLEHHCIPVTEFNCTYDGLIHGSVNGLVFYYHRIHYFKDDVLYMLNPVTHEYIQIPSLREFACGNLESHTYGFGVGRITGLHKLVRIFHYPRGDKRTPAMVFPGSECQVYTLGTGLWRSIKPGPMFEYIPLSFGAFLNGNLHWLVFDLNSCPLISCFDLEGELFSIFPSPPALMFIRRKYLGLFTLEDGLCLSDCTSRDEIVIWLMKDYGVEKSWVKELVIRRSQFHLHTWYGIARPIKVFKNGDILVAWGGPSVFYYSRKSKIVHEINICNSDFRVELILHTSSFLSLKSFVKEKVISF